jgi:hypothetical protein
MKTQLNQILLGSILLLSSCMGGEKRYFARIDEQISKSILAYTMENNVDIKSNVIVTQWVVTPFERTDIYISSTNAANYKARKGAPTYYCTLDDGTIVFIYSNVERLIDRNVDKLIEEIDFTLEKYDVDLTSDTANFYYAPTWLYTNCSDTTILQKKIPALEYATIPCDYVLLQDSSYMLQLKKR